MRQVDPRSDRVAVLLEQITQRTGETNVDAVTRALEERLRGSKQRPYSPYAHLAKDNRLAEAS